MVKTVLILTIQKTGNTKFIVFIEIQMNLTIHPMFIWMKAI